MDHHCGLEYEVLDQLQYTVVGICSLDYMTNLFQEKEIQRYVEFFFLAHHYLLWEQPLH